MSAARSVIGRLVRYVIGSHKGWFAGIAAASLLYALVKPLYMVIAIQALAPRLGLSRNEGASALPFGLDPSKLPIPDFTRVPFREAIVWVMGLGFALVALDWLRSVAGGRVVWGAMRGLRQMLCEKLLTHPVGFFDRSRSGELLSRIANDVEAVRTATTFMTNDAFLHPLQIVSGIAACLWLDWRLTLLVVLGTLFVAWPVHALGRRILRSARKGMERMADMSDVLSQLFGGIRVVKGFAGEEREKARFAGVNERYFRQMVRIVRDRATSSGVVNLATYVGTPVLAGSLVWLIARRWIDASGETLLQLAGVLGGQVISSIRSFTRAYSEYQYAAAGIARTYELLDEPVALADAPDAEPMPAVRGEVAFEHVHFRYGDHPVLVDVHFTAGPGSVTALVGPSGAGKSTILDLIPRFYEVESGAVRVDGRDVRRVRRADLLAAIGIVDQETFLFNASVEENLRYGRSGATREELDAAVRAANLEEVVRRLPQGLETVVGERGSKLSGGERQRLSIARALLKDPRILLLDEATSDLDAESERKVTEALERVMAGRTTFIIAHRLSTVERATRILVVEGGRIVESGTHRDLLARGGLYQRLHEQQFRA